MRLISALILVLVSASPAAANPKSIVGWMERVRIVPLDFVVHAKLNTALEKSSINAKNVERFKKNGRTWVRFPVTNRKNQTTTIEAPLTKRTRRTGLKHKKKTEPIIRLNLCLGGKSIRTPLILRNRNGFDYQIVLGRDSLSGTYQVDPSWVFLGEPNCKHN